MEGIGGEGEKEKNVVIKGIKGGGNRGRRKEDMERIGSGGKD